MTVSSTTRTAGPFTRNGSQVAYPFTFRVFTAADVLAVQTDLAGAKTTLVLGSDYTVAVNANQRDNPGGTLTMLDGGGISGHALDLTTKLSATQGLRLTTAGGFYPEAIEDALDKLTILLQQIGVDKAQLLRVPFPETLDELPPTEERLGLQLLFHPVTGQPFLTVPSSGTATDVLVQLAQTTGSTLISTIAVGTGAVGRSQQAKNRDWVNAADFGAVADGSTNNTTAVQAAITALGANGGLVQVNRNAKFNLQSLTFPAAPARFNLDFWMDDDLSRPNPSTTLGTNERVLFMANANAGGIVNETRFTATLHPAIGIDIRRDVAGHDASLGAGQARVPTSSIPARGSLNIFDQQVDTYRMVAEIYGGAYSQFTGITSHAWRRVVTITGIGTGAGGFVSTPAVGTELTGSVSGAKGWFLSATSTTTTILWNSGKFAVGDKLIDDNETTVNTASAVAFSLTPMQPMGTDLRKGNWSVGLPAGLGDEVLNVGGRAALLPTRSFSQHVHKTITHPGLVLADLVADVPTNGFVLHYDTTAAAASRRPTFRRMSGGVESTQDGAHAAANRAFVQFTNSAIKSASSFNVSSVVRTGTGVYEVNIPAGVIVTVDPVVTFGTESPLSYATCDWTASTATKLVIKVYTTGTNTPADVIGRLSVSVCGGDI